MRTEYAIEILKEHLRNELRYAHDADEHIENAGGVHFEMTRDTKQAFQESRRIAWERIPQLKKAIELLETNPDTPLIEGYNHNLVN